MSDAMVREMKIFETVGPNGTKVLNVRPIGDWKPLEDVKTKLKAESAGDPFKDCRWAETGPDWLLDFAPSVEFMKALIKNSGL